MKLRFFFPLFLAPLFVEAQITVNGSGDVGIGTTTPQGGRLDVYQATARSNAARFEVNNADTVVGFDYGVYLKNRDTTNGNFASVVNWDANNNGNAWIQFINLDHTTPKGAISFVTRNGGSYDRRLYINEDGNVGIGTNSPLAKLTIESVIPSAGARPNGGIRFGTPNNQNVSGQIGLVQNSSEGDHYLLIQSVEDFVSWRPVVLARDGGNVGIGTISPSHKLQVAGSVRATSFISDTTTYADFVFDEDYDLPSLSEVEAHIDEHGHLPDIPSEVEAMAHGIDLAAMQVKLLQKIEELTLHQIAQEKRLNAQSQRIEALEAENRQLRSTTGF